VLWGKCRSKKRGIQRKATSLLDADQIPRPLDRESTGNTITGAFIVTHKSTTMSFSEARTGSSRQESIQNDIALLAQLSREVTKTAQRMNTQLQAVQTLLRQNQQQETVEKSDSNRKPAEIGSFCPDLASRHATAKDSLTQSQGMPPSLIHNIFD
jgi:hypothetical protein